MIKNENAGYTELQGKIAEVTSLLKTCQQKSTELTSVKFQVKLKAVKKAELTETWTKLDEGHTLLKDFLETSTESHMEAKFLTIDDEEAKISSAMTNMEAVVATGETMLDAAKRAITRAKGLVD